MNELSNVDLFDDGRDPFSPVAIQASKIASAVAAAEKPLEPRLLRIAVVGTPRPQGSKKAFVSRKTGRAFVVDDNSEKLGAWRQDVVAAGVAATKGREGFPLPPGTAIRIVIWFMLPRPKGHWRVGRYAHLLRDDAPSYPTTKPDIDKLSRSTLDALRDAGSYVDDCQIVAIEAKKVWATERVGAVIELAW